MKILLAEDDSILADGILQALRQSGYMVEHTCSGAEAAYLLKQSQYDTAILDLGLLEMDGLDVLKSARLQKNHVPIMILTARDTLEDRIQGLDLGADDYMTKPFKLQELEARLRALSRRRHLAYATELMIGPLKFDLGKRRVFIHQDELFLTARELDILEILMKHSGKVVCKDQLIEALCNWQQDISANAIEVYISRLRKKLEPTQITFRTIRGIGYLLEP